MDKAPTFVGIDVSKHRLDVHARPSPWRLGPEHPAELVECCHDVQVLVGVDATGDDELAGCQSCQGPSFSREGKGGHGAS